MAIGNEGRDLVTYLLFLIPLEFIMTSSYVVRDGNRRQAVLIAGCLLAVLSSVKIGLELVHKDPSFYDLMEVLPSATLAEVKKGYKKASLRVHPDKLQAAGEDDDGDEAFVALKAAYDVLNDREQRDMYDKFGPMGLDAKSDTTDLLAGLGFFYVVWLTVAYLLTRRKAVSRAQTWTFTGLLALGIFEYQACILSFDFLQDALPQLAMFEKIDLLHRVYPVYLLGARMVAFLSFEDIETHNFVVLQHLHAKTDRLMLGIRQIQLDASSGTPSREGAKPDDVAAAAGLALPSTADPAGDPFGLSASDLQEQYRPLHPAMVGQSPAGAKAPKAQAGGQKGGGGRGMGSLVWFFGVYFFFQWLLGRGS